MDLLRYPLLLVQDTRQLSLSSTNDGRWRQAVADPTHVQQLSSSEQSVTFDETNYPGYEGEKYPFEESSELLPCGPGSEHGHGQKEQLPGTERCYDVYQRWKITNGRKKLKKQHHREALPFSLYIYLLCRPAFLTMILLSVYLSVCLSLPPFCLSASPCGKTKKRPERTIKIISPDLCLRSCSVSPACLGFFQCI